MHQAQSLPIMSQKSNLYAVSEDESSSAASNTNINSGSKSFSGAPGDDWEPKMGTIKEDHPCLVDLRIVKAMYTEGLISEKEYNEKKVSILNLLGNQSTQSISPSVNKDMEISRKGILLQADLDARKERRGSNSGNGRGRVNSTGGRRVSKVQYSRGQQNTIDPGLKLLGKRLAYFRLPSTMQSQPPITRRNACVRMINLLRSLCGQKSIDRFDSGGHHKETFAQKLAEGMLKGKTRKNVLHGPKVPVMYKIVSLMKYTTKKRLFCYASFALIIATIMVALLYFFGGCGDRHFNFGVIFLQSMTQLFGAVPEGINVTQTHCSIVFSITSALGVGLKSFAFAFCVGLLQEAAPTLLFSRVAAVRTRDGVPILMMRVDAPASRCLLDVNASGEWFYSAMSAEKEKFYKFEPLRFETQSTLQLSTILTHKIDHLSPLFGKPLDSLEGIISVQIRATDVLTRKEIRAVTMYMCDTDIRINHKFKDVVRTSGFVAVAENRPTESDLFLFHETEPISNTCTSNDLD